MQGLGWRWLCRKSRYKKELTKSHTVHIICTVNREPHIRIQIDGEVPAYRQIVDQVRTHCVEGNLQPGQTLPSARRLAAGLGVHFNTVAEAYRVLAEEGWLAVRQGRNVQVLERDDPRAPTRAQVVQQRSRLRHLVAAMQAEGFSPEWIRNEMNKLLQEYSQ